MISRSVTGGFFIFFCAGAPPPAAESDNVFKKIMKNFYKIFAD